MYGTIQVYLLFLCVTINVRDITGVHINPELYISSLPQYAKYSS